MPAALHSLLPWRAFDESSELYVNAGSAGFVVELPPFAGIDAETLGAVAGTLADAAPERCTVQVIHWASPRFGAASRAWAEPRAGGGDALARMGARRAGLLASGGWRRLHGGGPPFTLSDYRVFVTACLAGGTARSATPGPGRGDRARRLPPGARRGRLPRPERRPAGWSRTGCSRSRPSWPRPISAASATAATERPPRRWAPRDPLHEQCIAPGRALTVHPTGLTLHHPDGEDVAVRVLSAIAFPEVWPAGAAAP